MKTLAWVVRVLLTTAAVMLIVAAQNSGLWLLGAWVVFWNIIVALYIPRAWRWLA